MKNELIAAIKDYFKKDPNIRLAILFGSYARGSENINSDIDIAVAYPEKLSMDNKITLIKNLSTLINKEIDIVDLLDVNLILLQQIMKHRVTLVNLDSELYGNLMAKRVTSESDYLPLYDKMLKARRERFLNG
jgi:predicted nucleotidyltransferase